MLLALAAVTYAQSDLDKINIEQVLGNERILSNHINCLLDKGPCTQTGRDLKCKYQALCDAFQQDYFGFNRTDF
jgi:hypothetical protein